MKAITLALAFLVVVSTFATIPLASADDVYTIEPKVNGAAPPSDLIVGTSITVGAVITNTYGVASAELWRKGPDDWNLNVVETRFCGGDEVCDLGFSSITENLLGQTDYKIRAWNVNGVQKEEVFSINVVNELPNNPPVFQNAGTIIINEESQTQLDLKNYFSDADGDALTFSVTNNDYLSATDNGNGKFTLTAIKPNYNGQASLQVSASDGNAETAGTVSVNIKQVYDAPVLIPIEDQIVIAGQQFTLSVNANDVDLDADLNKDAADVLTFSDDTDLFNINKDTGAISFTPTEADVGDYNIRITVKDKGDYQDEKEFKLSIRSAVSPKASLSITEPPFLTGKELTFDGTLSTPFDKLTKFEFDFGDGTTYTEAVGDAGFDGKTTHTYADAALYAVSLTVYTEDDDNTIQMSLLVTNLEDLENKAPKAKFTLSKSIAYVGELISFDASDSSDEDGLILQYAWDFGDGSEERVTQEQSVTHRYSVSGVYEITLTVTDNERATDAASRIVNIKDRPETPAQEPVQKKRTGGGGGGSGGPYNGGGAGTDTWVSLDYIDNAAPEGKLRLESTSIDAKNGKQSALPVIIKNSGSSAATFELQAHGAGVDAFVLPAQFELAPGEKVTAYVNLMPQSAGEHALSLGLLANGNEIDSASVLVNAGAAASGSSGFGLIVTLLIVVLASLAGLGYLVLKKA